MTSEDEDRSLAGDSSESEPVETLIAGRERRKNAGRNMSTLLDAEADDELNLLFAEDGDDADFEEDIEEDAEDMIMDSSSDEEDQGPNAGEDDLEGERELQRELRVERAKKRKAQESLRLATIRKKVKIDPTAVSKTTADTTTPRPKKKSERTSWLPTPEDGPTRSSSRRQTMQNKELIHARLKDSEQRRQRLLATMEQAAKRKEKLKPRPMTQAERLAEAVKVEQMNNKSLNRWEEMERKKAEERKAKMEALKNRRLEGPVMSWWSGVATWVNGKLVRVGKADVKQKPDKEEIERRRKSKAAAEQAEQAKQEPVAGVDAPQQQPESLAGQQTGSEAVGDLPKDSVDTQQPADKASGGPPSDGEQQTTATGGNRQSSPPFQVVTKPPPELVAAEALPTPMETGNADQAARENPEPSFPAAPVGSTSLPSTPQPPLAEPVQIPTQGGNEPGPPDQNNPPKPEESTTVDPASGAVPPPTSALPEVTEKTGRNAIILDNFDEKTAQSREYSIYFNSKKPPRLTSTCFQSFFSLVLRFCPNKADSSLEISSHLCPITSLPARYRDPETDLPFANALAYREIRNLLAHKYTWSSMLGCYVGNTSVAAKGVPEQFLTGIKKKEVPKTEAESDTKATVEPLPKAEGGSEKT